MTISAVILTKNEEKNIERCIPSLSWCDEIVIIDDYSQDETIERIKNNDKLISYSSSEPPAGGESRSSRQARTIKIFRRHLDGNFAGQRNFGLEKASGDWVLFVDADEEISKELASEIKLSIVNGQLSLAGFYFRRKDYFMGKWLKYGETSNVNLLRLARKRAGSWERKVHETWNVEGEIGELKNPILHHPHQTISEFLQDINWYTDLVAQCWREEGRKMEFLEIIFYPLGKFLQNYFIRRGFLDGIEGLILAIFMSFHSFLARSKYWLKFART